MNYDDFKKAFTAEMMARFEEPGFVISEKKVNKVNQTMDALVVSSSESRIAPQIYINEHFKKYEQGRDFMSLVSETSRNIEQAWKHAPEIPRLSHEYLEENLYLTVMNPEMNRELLDHVPHEYLEDMAVVPRVRISDEGSFVVENEMLGPFGFSKEDLFQAARANMEQQDYQCMTIGGMLEGFGMGSVIETGASASIYVLTNRSSVDGAAAILSEKAMKQARDMVGEDFFILPSSRHEVILVPRSLSITVAEMTDMVVFANNTVVEDKDKLSDHVYRYNSNAGTIKMLEPKNEVPKKEKTEGLWL